MKSITNAQAPWIIESIVYARKCRQYAMFHEGTSNRCSDGLRFTVEGFDHDRHRIYFIVKKAGLPAAHNVRVISKDGEGEYFTLGQFTRNYTQTVKRAADNKRRYAPGEGSIPPVLLSGVSKGVPPLAHDFACKV